MKVNLKELVRETVYSLSPYIRYSIFRSGDKWVVSELSWGPRNFPFKLAMSTDMNNPSGIMAGGGFDSLQEAENELKRIFEYYLTPFNSSQVMYYFTEDWIESEEQAEDLRKFRSALYGHQWMEAARIYNQRFTNFTKEAIPDIVVFQVAQKLPISEAEKM